MLLLFVLVFVSLLEKNHKQTKKSYFLEFCLNDRTEVSALILAIITDHRCVLTEFTIQVDVFIRSRRSVKIPFR